MHILHERCFKDCAIELVKEQSNKEKEQAPNSGGNADNSVLVKKSKKQKWKLRCLHLK